MLRDFGDVWKNPPRSALELGNSRNVWLLLICWYMAQCRTQDAVLLTILEQLNDSYTEDRTGAFERKWTLAMMGERAQLGMVGAEIAIF